MKVVLPKLAQRYIADGVVAVEAAPCSRARESLLMWAMLRERCVVFSARPGADKKLLDGWGLRKVDVQGLDFEDAPYHSITDVLILDADLAPDPASWIAQRVRGELRVCGEAASPDHWWGRLPKSIRVTAQDAVDAGECEPRVVERARRGMSPEAFKRKYMLDARAENVARVRINVFARTRLHIRTKEGQVVPFRMNGMQRSYEAVKEVHRRRLRKLGLPVLFQVLKARRMGVTTLEQGESYELCVTQSNVQAVTLAHTNKATSQIFRIAQLMHRKDPRKPQLKGVGNARQLEFADLNSQFFIGTAGASGESRGDTLQRVHGSEVSKWGKGPRRHEQVRDLVAGLTEAASHGEVVLETTANGVEWFAETWRASKAKENLWTRIFLPWYWDPTYRMPEGTYVSDEIRATLDDRERFLVERERLSVAQIAWRRMKIKTVGPLFIQEYPEDDESCFLSVGHSYFTASTVLDLIDQLPLVDGRWEDLPSGRLAVWEKPQPGVEYVAGVDTSEGNPGSDPNGIGILRRDTGDMVAAAHGVFTPRELAGLCRRLCTQYNDALLGVERNNHGHAVLDRLTDGGQDEYRNLYVHDDGKIGWNTDAKSRPRLLADLREAMDEGSMGVRDREFLGECSIFVKQPSGKYEGRPDDRVMKWGIAWQMREYAPPVSNVTWVNR